MQQTKVVSKVRENIRSYPNKRDVGGKAPTIYVHGITLEGDPLEYQYHSQSQTCTKFLPTQEATFTTEADNYGNHKIAPVMMNRGGGPSFGKPGGYKAQPKDEGLISALSAASSAATYYGQRQGSHQDLLDLAEKIFQFANSKSTKS